MRSGMEVFFDENSMPGVEVQPACFVLGWGVVLWASSRILIQAIDERVVVRVG